LAGEAEQLGVGAEAAELRDRLHTVAEKRSA